MRLRPILQESWPPLAWIAKCQRSDPVIEVRHGSQVECRPDWLCESVWDGEFESGDFDQTDLVFGSGVRLRDQGAVFVSSASTCDRLQFLEIGDTTWVSNSLACLLGISGVGVDANYDRYFDFFWSVTRGLDAYESRLPTTTGKLEFVFFRNLMWDGEGLSEEDKPFPVRSLGSFREYREFLETSLVRIAGNMLAAERAHRYQMVGSLSSGYDSTTSTVLAAAAGLTRVFSFRSARGGVPDHGEHIARALGLDLTLVERTAWREEPFSEVPYLAVDGAGQDIVFSSARAFLEGRVLISGFHGDKVWAKETKNLGPTIVRGDPSGLTFTEHRLALGCIHLPVPFLGVRQLRDVNALSNSPELAAWDLPGDYSRPICRRIVEDYGMPRETFGMQKKAATNHFRRGEAVLTEQTRVAYYAWLRSRESLWRRHRVKGTRPPGRFFWIFYERYPLVSRAVRSFARRLPERAGALLHRVDDKFYRRMNRRINLVEHLFPWAVEELATVYVPKGESPR